MSCALVGILCVGGCSGFTPVVSPDLGGFDGAIDLTVASADLSTAVCTAAPACTYPNDSCGSGAECYPFGAAATAGPGYCLPVLFRSGCSNGACSGGMACYLAYDFCLNQDETNCVCNQTPAACGF
jgi:hypothetical protein